MSKDLEAFNRISESLLHAVGGIGNAHYIDYSNSAELAKEDLDIIETALKDYEQYKIIEEELGIDLITLCTKVTREVWYKYEFVEYEGGANFYNEVDRHIIVHNSVVSRVDFQHKSVYIKGIKQWFSIKDYGKTWALTKEELL